MGVEEPGAPRRTVENSVRRTLRARDALVVAALAVWVGLILENYGAPPLTPPVVPYAAFALGDGRGAR